MTEKPKFDRDDDSITHALRGLDRGVDIQPAIITRNIAEQRKRKRRVRMGSIVGVATMSLALVIAFMSAPSSDLNPSKSKSLIASISAKNLSVTPKKSSELDAEPPPSLSPLSLVSDDDLRLLKAERDRLRREVADLSVRQSKQIHRQMRNTASVSIEHPIRFANAF